MELLLGPSQDPSHHQHGDNHGLVAGLLYVQAKHVPVLYLAVDAGLAQVVGAG